MNRPFPPSLEAFRFGAERLLLPLDLAKIPFDALDLANRFTRLFGAEVTLLYVFERSGRAGEGAVAGGELRRAEFCLRRIGDERLRAGLEAVFRIRVGNPAEEIASEAIAARADLLVLPVPSAPRWRAWLGRPRAGRTVREVVARAPCRAFVYETRGRFNCLRRWREQGAPAASHPAEL